MQKRTISLVLCLALLISAIAFSVPAASAATAPSQQTGVSKIESADDFSWDNANVYFLLTDRFKNGNTSNDHSYGRTLGANGQPIAGWDTAPATFHGGDFAGITQKINEGYFDDLGVNAIWISAPYEQIHGYVDSGDDTNHVAHYSYHGYYVLDYTETDDNFGTKQEFKTLVDTAHSHGIRVVMDIVMNHAGYNNIVDMETYNYGTIANRSALDQYKYKLTDVSGFHSYIDYESSASDWGRWWGTDWVRSGLPGYQNDGGGELTGCLADLPDFRTESTATVSIPTFLQQKWTDEGTYNTKVAKYGSSDTVRGYLTSWLAEWVEQYGVDGFRCDTAKHVENASWAELKTKCVQALKTWRSSHSTSPGADWDEDFWMTGEAWGMGVVGKNAFYTEGKFDSMINFEVTGSLGANSGLPSASQINDLYQRYANSINSDPDYNVLTYMSSHDTNLIRKDDNYYQATALLLCPGAVQPFYGDETARPFVNGIPVEGGGHALRSDMNWGQNTSLLTHWKKVGKFRSNHIAVGAGDHDQIQAYSASNGLIFSRTYDDGDVSDGVICVIGAPKNTSIEVPVSSIWGNGKTVTNEYDGTTAVVQNGKATFNSGSQGVILVSGPQPTIRMTVKGEKYSFLDSQTVTVSLSGADYAMVSVNGGSAFRVTDGQSFEIGDGIEVGTVFGVEMTATNATETLTKTVYFKKKDPNAITNVYFDNTSYRWSTVNAYVYEKTDSSVTENKAWPGEAMTYDSTTGLYVYEVPDELAGSGLVVFNAGVGAAQYPATQEPGLVIEETDRILKANYEWSVYNGETAEPTTAPDPSQVYTVYYKNTGNYSQPYCYYWVTDPGPNAWPGQAMTKVEGTADIWQVTVPKAYPNCIFNNNSGSQTATLTIPGDNYCYTEGSGWALYDDQGGNDPTPTDITIYYDNSSTNWGKPCCYYWVTDPGPVAWPGATMVSVGNNIYKATFSSQYNNCIFSNDKADQTSNLTIPGDGYIYRNGSWSLYDIGDQPTTAQPTTVQPTTVQPTTVQPTTVKPTVQPTTVQPTTVQPTTVQPTTSPVPSGRALVGDADLNAKVNVKDATLVQRHIAEYITLTGKAAFCADTDNSKTITILDVTYIQRYAAEMTGAMTGQWRNYNEDQQPATVQPTTVQPTTVQPTTVQPTTVQPTTVQPTTAPPTGDYVILNATACNTGEEEWYAWTWETNQEGVWITPSNSDPSALRFDNVRGNILFVRKDPASAGDPQWNVNIWNQTDDIVVQKNGTYRLTDWNSGTMLGEWASSPQPVTNPDTTGDYVILNATVCNTGEEQWYAWTWNTNEEGVWITPSNSDPSALRFDNVRGNILFVRKDPASAGDPQWNVNIWNQTSDIVVQKNGTYRLTDWNSGTMLGEWQ